MRALGPIVVAIEAEGLAARGVVDLVSDERAGDLADSVSLVLIGMIGAANWPAFARSPEACDGARDPLDRWSRRVINKLAHGLGAKAVYPFEGPPYRPFQRWAKRAEPVHSSPLGLLIHPRHGLWHSYRGALAFVERVEGADAAANADPCASCFDKPCLSTCPVGAFSQSGYDVDACARHLRTAEGQVCMQAGCLARRACPVAPELRHGAEQAQFHMAAFLSNRN